MSPFPTSRRSFLRTGLAGAAAWTLAGGAPAVLGGGRRRGPAIERIAMLTVPGRFYRPIAMNAYDDAPKGRHTSVHLCRIELDDGSEGIGVMGYRRPREKVLEGLRAYLGLDPADCYRWEDGRITGLTEPHGTRLLQSEYSWFEAALLDTLGRRHGQPVWRLFGPAVRDAVDCYDGSLYFADVRDEQGPERIGELAAAIRADGYRAIKMKVGRPGKWMKGEAGVQRDIECVRAARAGVGANFNLMADGNNGYRGLYDEALRFLEAVGPEELYWIEEIFPEDEDAYRRLRKALFEAGATTRIAEGENALFGRAYPTVDAFEPWLEKGLFDVIQPDMRTMGFSNALRAAALAAEWGVMFVPHNWNSEMGKLMSIHVSRLRQCVRFVEDDRWSNDALDVHGYRFEQGRWLGAEEPGWGVTRNEVYERAARERGETVLE